LGLRNGRIGHEALRRATRQESPLRVFWRPCESSIAFFFSRSRKSRGFFVPIGEIVQLRGHTSEEGCAKMPSQSVVRCMCCLLISLVCFVSAARGQTETATISGLITDGTGAIVPGAEVRLQSSDRGTTASATTNNAGIYVFASVQPGPYQVTVQKRGFKQVDFLGLFVNVQDHIEQNFRLQVGSVSESVTVTGNELN